MKNDLECFCNDNLYICVTGFHAYEKEGMGLRKFGKITFIFLNDRMEGGKAAKIVAKASHDQQYPMPLC